MSVASDGGGTSFPITEAMLLASSQSMDCLPVTTPQTPQSSQTNVSIPTTPRIKAYRHDLDRDYVVFFRPKSKRLNTSQINKDLTKRYSSVVSIDKIGSGKLRVTVGDRKQANEIVSSELFTREYRVYLPSHEVEITGVVTEASMSCEEIRQAKGYFKNRSIPSVEILDCKQMSTASQQGDKKVYSHSDSFRVTFSGSALPDYILIGKLRLPVRLYVPRVMSCDNCKQLGHTTQYCCNKARCSSCGEIHVGDACKTAPKCVYCNDCPPHALDVCPTYIRRRDHQKRSLQQRSRRSYAEMVKKAASLTESNNVYSVLSVDNQGSDSEVGDGAPLVFKGFTRKRMFAGKQALLSSNKTRKVPRSVPQSNDAKSKAGEKVVKRSAPAFNLQVERDFPPLPGTAKIPAVPVLAFQPESQQQEQPQGSPVFTLSGIMELIFNAFNVSGQVKTLVMAILPLVTPLLKQLASKMPLLATIISFDG